MASPDTQLEEKLRDLPEPIRLLAGLFEHSPVAYQIYRADGQCLLTNRAFFDLFGAIPPPGYNVLHDEIAAANGVLGLIRSAFAGKTITVPTVWYDPRELKQVNVTEGRRVAISSTFFPLFDSDGKVSHVAIAYKDETRERLALEESQRGRSRAIAAERRAEFLAAASTALSSNTELDATLAAVARLATESFADWCAVTVRQPDGSTRRVAVVHKDPAKQPLADRYQREFPPSNHRAPELLKAVRERRALLWASVDAAGLASFSHDVEHKKVLEELGVRSAILVPLFRGETPLGVISLVISEPARGFTSEDLETAQDLAGRIALALENARLFEETRRAEEQFRELVENLPELAWSTLPDGRADFFNKRWFEYTGTTFEQTQGWGWQTVVDPAFLQVVTERWRTALESREPVELEFPLRAADGSFHWFLTRVRPLKDSKGRVSRWIGTNTNIDEQRRVQAELQRAVAARDMFLSVASHELRTPLTPLMLKLQMLETDAVAHAGSPLADLVVRHTPVMRRQVDRLAAMVHTLLDVSRITAGKLSLELADVDLAAALRDVVARFDLQAQRCGSAITLEAPDALTAECDRVRLEQIAGNLLDNALKYGGGKPVRVALVQDDDEVVLTVADQGIGIAREDLDRVFERFERAVSDRNYAGLGLGLYITRTVTEALGGTVSVESAIGEGSTFTVRLPLRR